MIYLCHLDDDGFDPSVVGPWREIVALLPRLALVESDQTRSVVYHALKDELPVGTALLVTELTEVPKFKGMAPGSLAWVRARLS